MENVDSHLITHAFDGNSNAKDDFDGDDKNDKPFGIISNARRCVSDALSRAGPLGCMARFGGGNATTDELPDYHTCETRITQTSPPKDLARGLENVAGRASSGLSLA
jgi:hypothetical protein